jgi:hypothetical protein
VSRSRAARSTSTSLASRTSPDCRRPNSDGSNL